MFSVIVIQDENKYEYMFCNEDLYVPEFLFIYITVFIYIGYVKEFIEIKPIICCMLYLPDGYTPEGRASMT